MTEDANRPDDLETRGKGISGAPDTEPAGDDDTSPTPEDDTATGDGKGISGSPE
ncbi:hypothetical protein LX16_4391 [Stackebrandtia albiflava]|uniref:Uncharacterized protein n=2 Tax=Stackebrandtia albiflava TaxID=406432 RepID=A0A562URC3_9ACTN|nr:hypothetical protein LX16_4391 [Stackebrandtia albiflava]